MLMLMGAMGDCSTMFSGGDALSSSSEDDDDDDEEVESSLRVTGTAWTICGGDT